MKWSSKRVNESPGPSKRRQIAPCSLSLCLALSLFPSPLLSLYSLALPFIPAGMLARKRGETQEIYNAMTGQDQEC